MRSKPVVNLQCRDFPKRLLFTRIFMLKNMFTLPSTYQYLLYTLDTWKYIHANVYRYTLEGAYLDSINGANFLDTV